MDEEKLRKMLIAMDDDGWDMSIVSRVIAAKNAEIARLHKGWTEANIELCNVETDMSMEIAALTQRVKELEADNDLLGKKLNTEQYYTNNYIKRLHKAEDRIKELEAENTLVVRPGAIKDRATLIKQLQLAGERIQELKAENVKYKVALEIYAQMGDENSVAAKALKGDTNETP